MTPSSAAPALGPLTDGDPFAAVRSLGGRALRTGARVGIAVALLAHGGASADALQSLLPMQRVFQWGRADLHDFFWATYEVEIAKEKPAEPEKETPPPPPDPEPAPAPKAPAPKLHDDPYEPPPTPAKAAPVLTQKEEPEQPVDLTGNTIVTGDGKATWGRQSGKGTGDAPTADPNVRLDGKPGGKGTASAAPPPPPAPPEPDLSRAATMLGSTSWNCPFPPEADAEQIDQAVATILVTVGRDGTPAVVQVTSDPGHGFGRAARICALGHRFSPALDRTGEPIRSTMAPINVRFNR